MIITGDDTTVDDDVGLVPREDPQLWNVVPTVPAVIGTLIRVLKERCELRDLDRLGVGDKNYVLVVHLHPGGEEIAGRIAKAHRIDDRHAIRRSATVWTKRDCKLGEPAALTWCAKGFATSRC